MTHPAECSTAISGALSEAAPRSTEGLRSVGASLERPADLPALAAAAEVDVHLVTDPRDGRPADQLATVRERATAARTARGRDRLDVAGHPHPGARDAPERGIVGGDRKSVV